MAEHGLAPAYVKLMYHSQWGPHVMTRQTLAWIPSSIVFPQGQFNIWTGGAKNADTMIKDLVTLMLPDFLPTSAFDRYEIWTKASDTAEAVLVVAQPLAMVGTASVSGWEAAVEKTFTMRSAGNNEMKLVLLDSPSDNLFLKFYTLGTVDQAIINKLMADTEGWACRADDQPIFFRSASVTLNELLAKKYARR